MSKTHNTDNGEAEFGFPVETLDEKTNRIIVEEDNDKGKAVFGFPVETMDEMDIRLATEDAAQEAAAKKLRRNKAIKIGAVGTTAVVLLASNGGPSRVIEGARTLPSHIAKIVKGPQH